MYSMKGKQSKLLLCITEWFVFLKMSWGFDSLGGRVLIPTVFVSWDIHMCSKNTGY